MLWKSIHLGCQAKVFTEVIWGEDGVSPGGSVHKSDPIYGP